jgi:hypothetical protein
MPLRTSPGPAVAGETGAFAFRPSQDVSTWRIQPIAAVTFSVAYPAGDPSSRRTTYSACRRRNRHRQRPPSGSTAMSRFRCYQPGCRGPYCPANVLLCSSCRRALALPPPSSLAAKKATRCDIGMTSYAPRSGGSTAGKKQPVAARNQGVIVSVRGSVVDARFAKQLPSIYSLLHTGPNLEIAIEVQAQPDAHLVRGIALTPTQGLARGMLIEDSGGPLKAPVGKAVRSFAYVRRLWPLHRPQAGAGGCRLAVSASRPPAIAQAID